MMIKWHELLNIAQTISLSRCEDSLIWKLEPNGIYTVNPFYVVVNFRGILPLYVHAVWSAKVPPNIHFFLWLLAHNNLSKRQHVEDMSCVFCSESESCTHVFFTCTVASVVWSELNRLMGKPPSPMSFQSVAGLWVSNEKDCIENSVYAAVLWVL
jgi:hypothetical protein